jgi:hypothetical protein
VQELDLNALRASACKDTGDGLSILKNWRSCFKPFNRLGQEAYAEEGNGIGLVVTQTAGGTDGRC